MKLSLKCPTIAWRIHPHAWRRARLQQSHNGAGEAAGTNAAAFPHSAVPATGAQHRRFYRQRFLRTGLRPASQNRYGYGRLIVVNTFHRILLQSSLNSINLTHYTAVQTMSLQKVMF